MKVQELVNKLNLKVLSGEKGLDREIEGCYVSDLLSDAGEFVVYVGPDSKTKNSAAFFYICAANNKN